VKTPKVILPLNFDVAADLRGQAEHVGVTGCPACGTHYANTGMIIQCDKGGCDFKFPTNAWSNYSSGVNAARDFARTGIMTGGMRRKMACNYYRYGFENNPANDEQRGSFLYQVFGQLPWREIMAGVPVAYVSMGMIDSFCDRCGGDKDPDRVNRSGLCSICELETECRHRTSMLNDFCKAGVNLKELPKGIGQPCYWCSHGQTKCEKWEPQTVQEIVDDEKAMQEAMARMRLSCALVSRIRQEKKGTDWSGVETCPACQGRLHLTHAAYNGHIHGRCETEGCLSWME